MNIHEKYISRCIELAKNGLGTTCPNPLVGSVVVYEDRIIGEGWHAYSGGPHAEVLAIERVENKTFLQQATLYVNLEPCSHFGKTPPCADLIIKYNIPRVVIGTIDVNSKVCGNGIARLENSGCEVHVGVLEKECNELNKRFFTYHTKKRPYVFLKWAETADGFLDAKRGDDGRRKPNWISNSYSQQLAHRMRAQEEAILIGTNTALNDRPSLNVRNWSGANPMRILLDRQLKVSENDPIYSGDQKTMVLTSKSNQFVVNELVEFVLIDFEKCIAQQVCDLLYSKNIQSLIVEGGAQTLSTFINAGIWDEAHVFLSPSTFEKGLKAPALKIAPVITKKVATDTLAIYKNNRN